MQRPAATLTSLFDSGKLSELVQATVLSGGYIVDEQTLPLVVASLGMLGRGPEAEMLLTSHMRAAALSARMLAGFHILQGFCRQGQYSEARRILSWMLRAQSLVEPQVDPRAVFYSRLGFACYRYATGRLRHARWHAQSALRTLPSGAKGKCLYEAFLAEELLGYVLVLSGEVDQGLDCLRAAHKIAGDLGRQSSQQHLAAALVLNKARWQMPPPVAILSLRQHLAELRPHEQALQASLHLELARQYMLAPNLAAAQESLQAAARLLIGADAPRFEAMLSLRRFELLALCGEVAIACAMSASLLRALSREAEAVLRAEVLASRQELLSRCKSEQAQVISDELASLQRQSGLVLPILPLAEHKSEAPSVDLKMAHRPAPPASSELNLRQLSLLRDMVVGEAMDVQSYKRRFGVSEITACRDLTLMARKGYLQRIGKARATRYLRS